jgi:hypothetical protein
MTDTPAATGIFVTVPLETPLKRGDQVINAIVLRKPQSGELRGTNMMALVQMDTDQVQKVLPRISTPILMPGEITDVADLFACAVEIAGFLLSKAQKADFQPA